MIEAKDSRDAVIRTLVHRQGARAEKVSVLRYKRLGHDVAAAATFLDGSDARFCAVLGLRESTAQRWRGRGTAISSLDGEMSNEPWVPRGAWASGNDDNSDTLSIAGGWVNEVGAVSAVVEDERGTIIDDQIEHNSVIFLSHALLDLLTARVSLRDLAGQVTWAGPLQNR